MDRLKKEGIPRRTGERGAAAQNRSENKNNTNGRGAEHEMEETVTRMVAENTCIISKKNILSSFQMNWWN